MAKKVTEERVDQMVHTVIKPAAMNTLVAKVASANKSMDDGRQRKSELIADAVENQNLHKLAFSWFMKCRKMDPVKREELRFQFDVMCEREFGKNADLLRVTGEQPSEDADGDDEPDLRPDYLKNGSAAAPAPVESSAARRVRELADKSEANLSNVGRGKAH